MPFLLTSQVRKAEEGISGMVRRSGGARTKRRMVRDAIGQVGIVAPFIRKIPTYDMVGESKLDAIHEASMSIVEETGIEFRDLVNPSSISE